VRKVLYYAGNVLGVLGGLLLAGSVAAWVVGPEVLAHFYERSRPVLPFVLAGLVLVTLGVLLTQGGAPGAAPAAARCVKCGAANGGRARFCDQCGSPLAPTTPPPV
jgi:hypothetical protein